MGIPRPHTALPILYMQDGDRIEGERDVKSVIGTPFGCFLQLPQGEPDSSSPRGRRQIKRPTLLFRAKDMIGEVIDLRNEDELDIIAVKLTGPTAVRWQVVGTPEYLAGPRRLVGFQARLKRVED